MKNYLGKYLFLLKAILLTIKSNFGLDTDRFEFIIQKL